MSVKAGRCGVLARLLAGLLAVAAPASALDVFGVEAQVPETPAGGEVGEHICTFASLDQHLTLQDAAERALCNNPRSRQAWTRIRVEAAGVGVARAAYLPTLTASWQSLRKHSATTVEQQPQLASDTRVTAMSQSLSLNWLLYDFGARGAALGSAQALLMAARAGHEQALLIVFMELTQAYHEAQYAQGASLAAQEAERIARESHVVAQTRVQRGLAPISDALQARTAWAQAGIARVNAEREWQQSLGSLAVRMGLLPDTPLRLPPADSGMKPDTTFRRAVADLMEQAASQHPDVRATQARWRAAEAKAAQVRAQGRPSISLLARASRDEQPVRAYLGQPEFNATAREDQIGLQVNVPLFEGFGRSYQVRQALAQADLQGEALTEVQQQARLDVWDSYQALQAAISNLASHDTLLDVARRSLVAAESRYKLGVGGILELLSAQAALATASRQQLQARLEWQESRVKLAVGFGSRTYEN